MKIPTEPTNYKRVMHYVITTATYTDGRIEFNIDNVPTSKAEQLNLAQTLMSLCTALLEQARQPTVN